MMEMATMNGAREETAAEIKKAIEAADISWFVDILNSDCSLDSYDVLIEICNNEKIKEIDKCRFASTLLNKFNCQSKNDKIKKYPIHFAADNGHYVLLRVLLTHPYNPADVSVLTDRGETAVLVAVRSAAAEQIKESSALRCVQLLAKYNCDIHIRDNIGNNFTAVHLAANNNLWQIVGFLLTRNVNVDIEIGSTTARKLIEAHNRDWVAFYKGCEETGQDTREPLVTVLESLTESAEAKEQYFDEWLENNDVDLRVNELYKGRYTLLECAVRNKLSGVVKKLVSMKECDCNPALFAAVEAGYEVFSALTSYKRHKLVLKGVIPGPSKQTLLHRALDSPNADVKVVESLLEMAEVQMTKEDFVLWLDAKDYRGFTALHYATKRRLNDVPSILLKNGANMFVTDKFEVPAFFWMQPETIEEFLDSRITLTDDAWHDDEYALVFDYNFIRAASEDYILAPSTTIGTQAREKNNKEEAEYFIGHESGDNSGAKKMRPDLESLRLLATSPIHKHLLKHPAIKSFLCLKWHRLYWFFWVNFIFYSAFAASFTAFLLLSLDSDNSNNTSHDNNSTTLEEQATANSDKKVCIEILRLTTIILTLILGLREFLQLLILQTKYLTRLENWLEMTIVVLMCVYVSLESLTKDQYKALAAVLYLLVSLEMIMLMGRHPSLATYINMFIRVSVDFIKFLLWYVSMIIAFSVSFYIIFHKCDGDDCDKNFFRSIPTSFFKTLVMLSGEYETGEINFDQLSIYSHVIFLTFLFFMSIVLVNLLNGLAVSDTQEIKNEAELLFCVSQAKYYADIERTLLVHCEAQHCCNPAKVCARWIGSKILLLGNLLPENKVTVYLNRDNAVEPDLRLCKTDCFLFCCCSYVKLPYFVRKMCNVFNDIVKQALHVANKQQNQQDGNLDLVLARIDQLEQVLHQITKVELNSPVKRKLK